MIVSCTNCKSQYSVNDSKIRGKIFGFNCPKCGTNVEIDNRDKNKENELIEPVPDKITKKYMPKGMPEKAAMESEPKIGAAFSDEEGLIGDDGLIGDIMGSSDDTGVEFEEEGETAGIVKKKSGPGIEVQTELPSENELSGALENLSSRMEDEDNSFNIDDMDLPDLESLGDISDSGETAEDALKIAGQEDVRDKRTVAGIKKESEEIFEDDIPGGEESGDESAFVEDLTLKKSEEIDMDSIFMDDVKSDEKPSGKNAVKEEDEEEDITIDLDSLDIQLEEDFESHEGDGKETEELSDTFEPLNAESLDITDFGSDFEEIVQKDEKKAPSKVKPEKIFEDDEDITLDLDALDLTLDEVEELKEGEAIDLDDERISLSDAGLTPEELVKEDETDQITHTEDEDIRLTIDEVAPEVGKLPAKKVRELDLIDEELRVTDLEEFEDDDFFNKDEKNIKSDDIHLSKDFKEHESEISSPDADIRDTVPGGMVNFSIDYSLKFSRTGAIFRLLGLYPVVLIPHFIVQLIYSILSSILSFFNWIIIAFSGMHEEDFTEIQENTIRYMLSLSACCTDVVEEMPKFAGRKDINFPLQYDATYPIRYSRVMAVLRISVIGIILAVLPHLIIVTILSIGCAIIYLIGLLSIIIRKKWPKVLFDFMVRYYRYCANVLSFMTGVIDRYPSFKFE
jgi:predicted Zn finger-like uncharacterized protein